MEAYAELRRHFLRIDSTLSAAEKGTHYHRLADLYAADLKQPDLAREVLEECVGEFPGTHEAAQTKSRLRRMDVAAAKSAPPSAPTM